MNVVTAPIDGFAALIHSPSGSTLVLREGAVLDEAAVELLRALLRRV